MKEYWEHIETLPGKIERISRCLADILSAKEKEGNRDATINRYNAFSTARQWRFSQQNSARPILSA
jgi:hypothetical protein